MDSLILSGMFNEYLMVGAEEIPRMLHEMEHFNCKERLNRLDLFSPEQRRL